MNRNCHVFVDSRWAVLPPLLLGGSGILASLIGFSAPFKNCPKAFQ